MLGRNQVVSQVVGDGQTLKVHSIFYTIQGEGPDAGRPALFIRLAECNLRCHFCDTDFANGVATSLDYLMDQVKEAVRDHKIRLVVITGGEPLLQNIIPLVVAINGVGVLASVSIETAGTVYLPGIEDHFTWDRRVMGNLLVCSPKTPKIDPALEPFVGAYKYLVSAGQMDPLDGLPNFSTQIPGHPMRLHRPRRGEHRVLREGPPPIYLQPMDEGDASKNARNLELAAELCLQYGYRLSVQLHKVAGLP